MINFSSLALYLYDIHEWNSLQCGNYFNNRRSAANFNRRKLVRECMIWITIQYFHLYF